jgi:hypothetical protein
MDDKWKLVSVAMAGKSKGKTMWNKLIIRIVLAFLGTIDWVAIARRILGKMSDEVDEQLSVRVDLNRLDLDRLFAMIEEVLSDYCKINIDLNKDGKVTKADVLRGRGVEGFAMGGMVRGVKPAQVSGTKFSGTF